MAIKNALKLVCSVPFFQASHVTVVAFTVCIMTWASILPPIALPDVTAGSCEKVIGKLNVCIPELLFNAVPPWPAADRNQGGFLDFDDITVNSVMSLEATFPISYQQSSPTALANAAANRPDQVVSTAIANKSKITIYFKCTTSLYGHVNVYYIAMGK
jgi:hypothetical protein